MKILAIADKKPELLDKLLKDNNFDLIITLWDLYWEEIKEIKDLNIPKIGVYWNHCNIYQSEYMIDLKINNLHLKSINIWNYKFWWFEWCVRYKNQEHFMYTQKEANELINKLDKVDILIAHCPPKWINDNDDKAHEWFEALKTYIDRYNPKYFFHWHTYNDWKFIRKYKETNIIYVNWYEILDI